MWLKLSWPSLIFNRLQSSSLWSSGSILDINVEPKSSPPCFRVALPLVDEEMIDGERCRVNCWLPGEVAWTILASVAPSFIYSSGSLCERWGALNAVAWCSFRRLTSMNYWITKESNQDFDCSLFESSHVSILGMKCQWLPVWMRSFLPCLPDGLSLSQVHISAIVACVWPSKVLKQKPPITNSSLQHLRDCQQPKGGKNKHRERREKRKKEINQNNWHGRLQ